jgi:CRP-like cAMP-binding protein
MTAIKVLREHLKTIVPISDSDFEKSIAYFQKETLEKGEYFVKSGEVCKKSAFINFGVLRTFSQNEKGEDITYCFCDSLKFSTSFKSFITQTPSDLSIQALEKTEILSITYIELQTLYVQFPVWQGIGRMLIEKEYLVMEQYASSLNSETAKEKYLRLIREQPGLIQKVPVHYIASYLGISRETLSRIRKQVVV